MDGYEAIRSCSDRIITSSRISYSLDACFLGFACFILSLLLEPQRLQLLSSHSLALSRWSLSTSSCSLHTLSPSPDLNKTSLAYLSPHCWSKSRQDPSARKGRRLNTVAVGEGGNPLPAQLLTFTQQRNGRAFDPFFFAAVPSPTEPRPKNFKVYFTYSTCIALAACIP